jgi:transposase
MANVITNNQTQNEMIFVSRAEYEVLKTHNSKLTQQVKWLMEQMRLVRQRRSGASREKSKYDQYEAEVNADQRIAEPELTEAQRYYQKKTKESSIVS